jgi:hypothetical protein
MELIDTPGFNSGDASHDAVVRRAFEMADVAIWLFDARQAGRESERVALEEVRAAALPVLGVLNKIDQCAPEDHARLVAHLREGVGALAPCVAAVSARAALSQHDPEGAWQTLTRYLDEHLLANREAWKHARVARRCRVAVDEALAACDEEDTRQRAVQEGCAALSAAIATLREVLLVRGPALRRDVAASLREQLRGVADDRVQGREALVADAIAEVGWRARARALDAIANELRAVEELSARAGLVAPAAADVATAAVVQWFDRAVAEGTRDAEQPSHDVPHVGAFLSSDPLARIEAAAERRARMGALLDETLRVALHAARDALSKVHTPSVPLDGF